MGVFLRALGAEGTIATPHVYVSGFAGLNTARAQTQFHTALWRKSRGVGDIVAPGFWRKPNPSDFTFLFS